MSNITQRPRGRSQPSQERNAEFVVVRTTHGIYHVTRFEGARIADQLGRWWAPRWLEFTDVHESIIRIRTRNVLAMFDTSMTMRFSERALGLMLDREEARHLERLSTMLDVDPNLEQEGE